VAFTRKLDQSGTITGQRRVCTRGAAPGGPGPPGHAGDPNHHDATGRPGALGRRGGPGGRCSMDPPAAAGPSMALRAPGAGLMPAARAGSIRVMIARARAARAL
jgi:hypothetical protein